MQIYNEIAEEWNEYRQKPLPAFHLLLQHARGGVCLDAGTGNGRHLPLLAGKYREVHAIDTSKKLISIAKQRKIPRAKIKHGDITRLPFVDNYFNDVYSTAVLHHLSREQALQALREIHRVLKPSGLLLATVWNKGQEKFRKLKKEDNVPWRKKDGTVVNRFVHFFSEREIRQLARQSGFQIVKLFYDSKGEKRGKNGAHNLCFVLRKA
ncbi:methyltransferase domain-containing protein [Candidatus Micrarchaeota archaeon]|nr:methyltransferase domain-containing protein [Candidatus Micrarchaeota archaeon]